MSTPVDSRSTETTMPGSGPVAELADALQRPVHVGLPVIFAHERFAAAEDVAARSTSWSACDVCGRSLAAKISVFGNRPYVRARRRTS